MTTVYCLECGWRRRADDESTADLSRAMIDHHVETGHSPIERDDKGLFVAFDEENSHNRKPKDDRSKGGHSLK